ncbi:early endosome antigen 1 [Drosophila serrata]|uniref:early endosome antigen 1 n=1 Tax=Drosophila serrata TaxID=7274 RepID=UPI000A1D2CFC|nr:early endosome antigen 1 [Drosophila serrata]
MYNNLDLNALTVDDIVEEYKLLHHRHQQLKSQSDQDAQRIYELKRNLDTALAAEAYLTQELEQLSSQPQQSNSSGDSLELEDLRRKYRNLQEEQESLQQDYDQKAEEAKDLKKQLEAKERELSERASLGSRDLHEECAARLNALELENCDLMQKLADYEENSVKITLSVAEKDKTLECLADRVSCLEQNLTCKRDELEEKLQLLESCQEQLVDANAKIALLTTAPENNDRKGNSLFAEVDDQRQAMKQLLAAQKKSYLDMKKTYADSQFEIRRLKRENVAMHTELQACSTIFCSADKTYRSKLNERIRYLMAANDSLEKQLNLSQERLRDMAKEKAVNWLDSMLDFCKRETHELKTQVHSLRIQKAGLEDQMRSVQQEMARWRFESLKSRCVLIDRENLLTEHKIGFKPMQAMEFNIQEEELKAALPRIATPLAPATPLEMPAQNEIIILDTPMKMGPEEEPFLVKGSPKEIKMEPGFNPLEKLNAVKTKMGFKIKREEVSAMEEKEQENIPKEETLTIKQEAHQDNTNNEALLVKEEITQVPIPKPQMKGTPVRGLLNSLKIKEEEESPQPLKDLNQNELEMEMATETLPKPLKKGTPVKNCLGALKVKSNNELLGQIEQPAKPQRKGTPVKKLHFANSNTESDDEEEPSSAGTPSKTDIGCIEIIDSSAPHKPQRKGTPVRIPVIKDSTNDNVRSILAKKRDIFAEDSHKVVKFSENDPTIHNLSPVEHAAKENEKPSESEDVKDIKPTIRRPVVRRIVVSSRKPTMK